VKNQFSHKNARSSKDGYGNRRVTRCEQCGQTVYDGDPGNAAGFRYDNIYRQQAMDAHKCKQNQPHAD
jgi:hypothetical protein